MPTYDVPGVYIEEQTGPGVITGVGTSTAAFVGPALNGPLNEAVRISSFDMFLETYGQRQADGTFWPYIASPRWFYLAHAVRAFFENSGAQAYIVRVGTGRSAVWEVKNQDNPSKTVFRIQAKGEGVAGNNIIVQVQAANATGPTSPAVAKGSATVSAINGVAITVNNASPFKVGDMVTENESARAMIKQIQGNVLTLSNTITNLASTDILRIANIIPAQNTFRDNTGTAVQEYAVIESVDKAGGFVTLASGPARTKTFNLAVTQAPTLTSQEFRILITPPGGSAKTFDNLSTNPLHPNYIFTALDSDFVKILPPQAPPTATAYPAVLVNATSTISTIAISVNGQNDDPSTLSATEYEAGLKVLKDIDDVNIMCIPDAASHSDCRTIQQDMINHCLSMKDRFAILDSRFDVPVSGAGSVEEHRGQVQSTNGFAALYYPWVEVREPIHPSRPRPIIPPTMFVPPSGHMAGVFARTDNERGVHKSPANTEVRGVLGLERKLSDGQQGPLNLKGVNVLRIFPGSGQVIVWGARTTVDPNITDWLYVNVRRLMLYLEESIEEGIRWAVFEPNNLALWQKLKRTINEFLTRAWKDGALFGATADKAFYVRIDESLNPPSTRAIGRLYIEIGVAPVRPAEFIIVRIGLWDGGSDVTEG